MIHNIVIPALGATGGDVEVIDWLVPEGAQVKAGQPIFSISTDKAIFEVECFQSGFIRKIILSKGNAPVGEVVGLLGDSADEPLEAEQSEDPPPPATAEPPPGSLARTAAELEIADLLELFRRMVLIRRFEDYLHKLFLSGQVPGTLHQYQGQEAVAVGVCRALAPDDIIFSTHRPVGHHLAKGSPAAGIAAEIWGKATGCCGGKGGQMHLADVERGVMPANAIVGANIPIATGAALAFKLRGERRVAVSFFGDGAANIGAFHEGINFAAVTNAPVIFVCENNLYAASTHISRTMRITDIARRAESYGIPGYSIDGMDVLAVYEAAQQAVARARQGEGPTLLEYKTYRYAGHSRGDPRKYRSKEEVAEWEGKDPVANFRSRLLDQHGVEPELLDKIESDCQTEVEDAVRFAQQSSNPKTESCFENVYKQS